MSYKRKPYSEFTPEQKQNVLSYQKEYKRKIRRASGIPILKVYSSDEERRLVRNATSKELRRLKRLAMGIIPMVKRTPEEMAAHTKARLEKWHSENRLSQNAKRRERRHLNPSFKIAGNLRKRLSFLVRKHNTEKTKQTLQLLGCSMPFFLEHLENRFSQGMSWDNYGQWHIDHIKPCNSFDLTQPKDQHECFHYTNLQPLWANENRAKSDCTYWVAHHD